MKKLMIALLCAAPLSLSAADAPAAYAKEIMTLVMAKVNYPKMSKMRKQEGVVTLKITISSKGSAVGEVEKSSGFQSLDDAALEAVQATASFPEPPEPNTVVHGNVRFSTE